MRRTRLNGRFARLIQRRIFANAAFTLMETLVVLVLTGSIMGTTISLINLAQKSYQQFEMRQKVRNEIRSFANDFRSELRKADSVKYLDGKVSMKSPDQGRFVSYQIENESSVIRLVETFDQLPVNRNHYRFGTEVTVQFAFEDHLDSLSWTFTDLRYPLHPIVISCQTNGEMP